MLKRIVSLLLCIVLLCSLCGPAYATGFALEALESGWIGEEVTWTYTALSKLSDKDRIGVYGSGEMWDLPLPESEDAARWTVRILQVEELEIQSGVTSIGDNACVGAERLNSVLLPDTLTRIGAGAFVGCTSLKELTIPASVKEIGDGAFDGSGLKHIYFEGSQRQWEQIAGGSVPETVTVDCFNSNWHIWDEDYEEIIYHAVSSYHAKGISGFFVELMDIDMDGAPELLLGSLLGEYYQTHLDDAYTYKKNSARKLDVAATKSLAWLGTSYDMYRNTSTGVYRLESYRKLYGGLSEGYYQEYFFFQGDVLHHRGAYCQEDGRFFILDSDLGAIGKASPEELEAALAKWRSGWEKLESYVVCIAMFSQPTRQEIRSFLSTYPPDAPQNEYKRSVEENKSSRFLDADALKTLIDSAGGPNGGAAAILHQTYRDAGLEGWNKNPLWSILNSVKHLLSLDLRIENCYETVLADLWYSSINGSAYPEQFAEAYLSKITDIFTALEPLFSYEEAKYAREAMRTLAGQKNFYAILTGQPLNKLLDLVNDQTFKTVSSGVAKTGDILNILESGIVSAADFRKAIQRYALGTAYPDAALSYSRLLRLTSSSLSSVSELPSSEQKKAKRALTNLALALENAANRMPYELLDSFADNLSLFCSKAGMTVLTGFMVNNLSASALFSGVKIGLDTGFLAANQLTGVEDIVRFGSLMDCAGLLAEAMYPAVYQRLEAYQADNSYENAAAVRYAADYYLSLQLLAADYGIKYSQAMQNKTGLLFRERHQQNIDYLTQYMDKLERLRNTDF